MKLDQLSGKEVWQVVLDIINRRIRGYANTPVDNRKNAFEELYELEMEIYRLNEDNNRFLSKGIKNAHSSIDMDVFCFIRR